MAFTGFINEFSNSPIQPTYQSYLALDFTSVTSVQLEWPFVNPSTETPYAQTIQVTINEAGTNKIIMPDATQATQGQTNTITNSGAESILIYKFGGTSLLTTIEPSQNYLITLTDNTTSAGIWLPLQLASTTSAATAAELIDTTSDSNGHINSGGLAAFPTNYIKQNLFINKVLVGSTYTQASGDRGMILVWESGTGTYTCDSAADLGNGFSFTVINNSTVGGQLTISPAGGDSINGGTIPFVLNPGNSSSFSSDGASTIYSFAASQSQTDIVTLVDIDLSTAVGSSITLTTSEANYSIQKFIGTGSSSPISIIYPNNIINEWIAYNASSDTSVLVSLTGSSSVNYLIPPGNRLSLFSDGTFLYNTPNFLDDTTIYLADGTPTAPSLTFSEDNSTGLFRQTSGEYTGTLGITVNGTPAMYMEDNYIVSLVDFLIQDGSANAPALTFSEDGSTGFFRQTSGAYEDAMGVAQNGEALMYFSTSGNTIVNASTIAGPALNTLSGSYRDQGISIYSLMRAYG